MLAYLTPAVNPCPLRGQLMRSSCCFSGILRKIVRPTSKQLDYLSVRVPGVGTVPHHHLLPQSHSSLAAHNLLVSTSKSLIPRKLLPSLARQVVQRTKKN